MIVGWFKAHTALFRQGLRMAVAGTLAMAAVELLRLPSGFWAPLSAMAVLQGQIGASVVAARNYMLANITGVLLGAFIVATFGKQLAVAGMGIFLIASFATWMRLPPASAATASAIVPVLVLSVQGDPWRYGMYRILDIFVGLLSAILVSLTLFPSRAVTQLRASVAAAIADATASAAAALRALARGEAPPDATAVEERIAARLQAAQGLLPAARAEPLRQPAAHDLLPFYLSYGERIFEHASTVIDNAENDLPPDAVQALTPALAGASDALQGAGVAVGAAVTSGIAGEPAVDARSALDRLRESLKAAHAVDLPSVATGDDLLRVHSFVRALDDLADEMGRLTVRIEQPEQAATSLERSRMAADAGGTHALARLWRRLRATR